MYGTWYAKMQIALLFYYIIYIHLKINFEFQNLKSLTTGFKECFHKKYILKIAIYILMEA